MKTTKLILSLSIILSLAGCSTNVSNENSISEITKKVKVETVLAKKQLTEKKYCYSGIIEPSVSIPISFQFPGTITNIYVEEGDKVFKNQKLAEIDNTSFLSSYKAAIATQKQAKDAYERLKTVYEKGSLPEIQWEEIKTKLEQANAAAEISKQNLDKCILRAPSNGIVGARNIEIGASAISALSSLTIVEINEVYVKISVPENEINKIKVNQNAHVVIPAISSNDEIANVDKIGVMANPVSKTYEVKLAMKNPEHIIKPGMACDVDLEITDTDQSIAIPYQAVLKDASGDEYVYIINEETQTAQKQLVETNGFENNNIKISKGIAINDLIVTQGQHKLNNNSKVLF